MAIITSKSNSLIKKAERLLEEKYHNYSYLIEGWYLFEETEKIRTEFLNIFVLEDYTDRVSHFSIITYVTPEVLKKSIDSETSQGTIAEVAVPSLSLADLKAGRHLVLEDIQNSGNVGTTTRTADTIGLGGILTSEKSADIYNQEALHFTQGSRFHLSIQRTDMYEACQKLQDLDVPPVVIMLSKEFADYETVGHNGDFALVVGSEGSSISESMTKQAGTLAHIIMPGQAESLNATVATGIVLFQLIQLEKYGAGKVIFENLFSV